MLEEILDIVAAIFQFVAAYFGYRIWKLNRIGNWWLALVFAFVIQGVRRTLTFFEDIVNPLIGSSNLLDSYSITKI